MICTMGIMIIQVGVVATPENLRIRKTILNHEKRMKASHGGKKK